MSTQHCAEAHANANIALIKYWGKLDCAGNFPAVPSLSLTLKGLGTWTRIEIDHQLRTDEVVLDDEVVEGRARERVTRVLDEFRRRSNLPHPARVTSRNDFPTAAGLASSASGFAALVTAANAAFGTGLDRAQLSALARSASASAARSLYGGWVELRVGADAATPVAPTDFWPLVLLVAVTASGKKPVGSTEAMNQTRDTSPYYQAWLTEAEGLFDQARTALLERDLARLGTAMEQSTLMMHATMMAARPAVIYWAPGTLNAMQAVNRLRNDGTPCFFTMDAGPHVKVLCHARDASRVRDELLATDGVREVMSTEPGADAEVLSSP